MAQMTNSQVAQTIQSFIKDNIRDESSPFYQYSPHLNVTNAICQAIASYDLDQIGPDSAGFIFTNFVKPHSTQDADENFFASILVECLPEPQFVNPEELA